MYLYNCDILAWVGFGFIMFGGVKLDWVGLKIAREGNIRHTDKQCRYQTDLNPPRGQFNQNMNV